MAGGGLRYWSKNTWHSLNIPPTAGIPSSWTEGGLWPMMEQLPGSSLSQPFIQINNDSLVSSRPQCLHFLHCLINDLESCFVWSKIPTRFWLGFEWDLQCVWLSHLLFPSAPTLYCGVLCKGLSKPRDTAYLCGLGHITSFLAWKMGPIIIPYLLGNCDD